MQYIEHRLLMGAAGWQHEDWNGLFYPEDLPEEWRLVYYANEFPIVLVRHAEHASMQELEDFLENEDSTLRFVYELELGGQEAGFALLEQVIQKLAAMQPHCMGVLLRLSVQQQQSEADIRHIAALCHNRLPCCVDAAQAWTEKILLVLGELDLAVCWHANNASLPCQGFGSGAFAVARVSAQKPALVDLRRIIEHCLNVTTDERRVALIFDARPPQLELMRNARIIAELL